MQTSFVLAFSWLVVCYILSSFILWCAERKLDLASKDNLIQVRRPLRPVPFVFVSLLFLVIWLRPSSIWAFLPLGGSLVSILALWKFRRSSLPQTFKFAYTWTFVVLLVGICGFSFIVGWLTGFSI
jgi:hypothetical protein